ncbi:dihydrolipoamide acetyltransferase family protein [Actinoplanes derwentensis]|uniref:Dihydrolipoamide acetyltransferase component of pyruvate dehydrogenase complex n=1 Tax=Actinoplanes derwentensis TaxID=113562 RepID=A0A1H2CSK4_9ACTN|nr:dihydrolipoamide acetyltransferase family protein [Actinoplanes derwentensis]GID85501.1 dihydrolipoamide acetyltransferase component of pyruvate dehydrogenase complex [Actinoplanes derwentensis]SDT73344.1 pyruvate dehydrogenase E2 component (dihydrolipoamide acetyltransferase) [Actinoplanes derwentensis]
MSRIKEFNLPDLGEGLTEGEILAWLVKVGDTIELNQPIVEVETAKAAVEIPAKWGGVVTRIFHEAGTVCEVGKPIIAIDTDPSSATPSTPAATASSSAPPSSAPDPDSGGEVEAGLIGGPAPGGRTAVLVGYGPRTTSAKRRPRAGTGIANGPAPDVITPVSAAPAVASVVPAVRVGPVLAKPPVRKLARDLGVDLATVDGTGPMGSVTRDDLQRAAAPVVPETAREAFDPESRERRIPVKGVRKLTAANMVASAFTAPHVTEFLTVDVTRSMKALEKLKARPEFAETRVSPLLLVAKAVLLATARHPMVNSTWSGGTGEIVVKDYVNLGIAAATERGLIVPNVKDAARLSLRELAEALNTLVRVAKSGKTPPADMTGGTLSITNVGVFGIDSGTPILPPGESAILAFGAIRPMPWVHKNRIKSRQVTTLGLSFDHRIIDGELGSRFLRDIGTFLEDPEGALLSWT